jgi:hypothetical protein
MVAYYKAPTMLQCKWGSFNGVTSVLLSCCPACIGVVKGLAPAMFALVRMERRYHD